jgi:hypothetical protein
MHVFFLKLNNLFFFSSFLYQFLRADIHSNYERTSGTCSGILSVDYVMFTKDFTLTKTFCEYVTIQLSVENYFIGKCVVHRDCVRATIWQIISNSDSKVSDILQGTQTV